MTQFIIFMGLSWHGFKNMATQIWNEYRAYFYEPMRLCLTFEAY